MQEHLKNVKAEIEHTQGLVDAKGKEIETEDHLKQLSDREIGRIRQELKKLDIEAEDVQDQMNIVQNNIHKGTEKLEQFKLAMNFNQEDLEQWALAARQKEEDNIALMKYTKADEGRIKELTLSIEKITGEVQNLKSAVEQEVTEAAAKQIELERTAEEFRTLHKERQDLLRQWRETTEAIDRRRHEITEVAKGYAEVEARIEAKKAELKMQAKRLKQQEQENKEFEGKIALRQAEYTMAQSRLQEFQDEVEVLRNELQKAASDMANLKAANNNINADLEDARARYQATKRRLESAAKESDKMEAVAQEREKELLTEESRLKEMDKELRNKKEALFRENQAKFKLKQEEKTLDAELSGARSSLKNLNAKIHHLDQESLRQQELIYNADFQIQQMERKVARASGERSDEEKKALQARIAELQENLDGITAQVNMLQSQCKRLQEDQLEKELEGHREVQRAQLKLAEEERHKIAMDLKDRLQAIDKLKAKYDVLAGRMRGSSEDGEERSQAYFIIQAAQKREELQREGDELDAAIRQTEREIK
ncbi:CCDC39, partial [Symbiodinium sp. KB8]